MKNSDFYNVIAGSGNVTKETAKMIFDALQYEILSELSDGRDVQFGTLGKFKLKKVKAREGINHLTGNHYSKPERKKVVFRQSKLLEKAVNGTA